MTDRSVRGLGLSLLLFSAVALADAPRAFADIPGPPAHGVTAATVNGVEIGEQDIDAEFQAANVPPGSITAAMRKRALQHIIDRTLLVRALDTAAPAESPALSAWDARLAETSRLQAYAKQQLDAVPTPTDAQIAAFMAAHANAFAGRRNLHFEQIRFPLAEADFGKLRALEPDHTLDAVAVRLYALGIKFDRAAADVDTAQLPTKLVKTIDALPPGEPFVLPQTRGIVTISVVTGQQPVIVDPAALRDNAVKGWRAQQANALIGARLQSLRAAATILYRGDMDPR